MNQWYLIQFKPNSHRLAERNLQRQGFETFLPMYDSTSRKASRFVSASRPLFPGYMFIAFNKTNPEWHKINNTYGVSRLITFGTTLHSMPNTFIENLKKRCDFSDKLSPMKELKKGDYLIIPTNWLYFLETEEQSILYLNKVNNIFTILPNFIRDNYGSFVSFTLPDFISSVN